MVLPLAVLITCLSAMLALKVPTRLMLARITAPMGIVFVLVVMQSFTVGSTTMFTVSVGAWHGAVKLEGVIHGLLIGSRVLGAVSVMLLLSSVTPAHRILQALRWFRVSKGWVEIAMLMYRYTFTLLDHATDLAEAQRLRLGYCDVKRSLSSMGVLAGAVINSIAGSSHALRQTVTLRVLTESSLTTITRHARETDGSWSISPRCSCTLLSEWAFLMKRDLAIETSKVCFTYEEGTRALQDVDFRVSPGEFVALLASNGSGKTTLIKVLVGLLKPQKGEVRINGHDIRHLASNKLCQHVGLVFQNPNDQLFGATVEEDVAFGPRNLGLPEPEVQQRVAESLESVAALELRDRAIHHLSFGQQKRVMLAGVLAMRPSTLILDEPTAGLDPAGEALMMHLLNRLNREQGITVILLLTR